MICFCVCARDHQWDDPKAEVVCRCGRVLEGMTVAERDEAIAAHKKAEEKMLAVNDWDPIHNFFKD